MPDVSVALWGLPRVLALCSVTAPFVASILDATGRFTQVPERNESTDLGR
jgi:hypothetical protein